MEQKEKQRFALYEEEKTKQNLPYNKILDLSKLKELGSTTN